MTDDTEQADATDYGSVPTQPDQWSRIYDYLVPTNVRAYFRGLLGRTAPVDQSFFQPAELDALRVAAAHGIEDYQKPYAPLMPPGVTTLTPENQEQVKAWMSAHPSSQYRDYKNMHFNYEDYDNPWIYNRPATILNWFRDPSTIAQSTVGAARLEILPNGDVMVRDRYDFDPGRTLGTGIFSSLHRIGESLIPPGSGGYDVNVNLGNPATWQSPPSGYGAMPAQTAAQPTP